MEPIKQYSVTEISVSYKTRQKASQRPHIEQSSDALQYLLDGYDRETIGLQEQFVILYLNQANRVLGVYRASTGGITGTVCDIRLALSIALKLTAVALVVSHNHPSGTLTPSRADEELTRKLKEAARLMDIKLLDHLILEPSGKKYFSFADEGLI